jgi:hypothetical protein
MVPSGAPSRPLDYPYEVKLSRNSLVTYLPYIGRAFTGIMPNEAGVNFTSTDFSYKSKFRKKKWEVSIRPKNAKEVKDLQFTIYENGQATLLVIPNNKQSISYYGYLKSN